MDANPFDALAPKKAPNPFNAIANSSASKNPFDAFAPKRTAKPGPGIGDVLDAQRAGLMQAIFKGGSSDANRAKLRAAIPDLANEYAGNNQFERGLTDFALDTVSDPLTYETLGIGPLAKGAAKLGSEGLKAAKGVAAMPQVAPLLDRAKPQIEGAQHLGQILHDYFTFAGPETRSLGKGAVDTAVGAESRRGTREGEAERLLHSRFNSSIGALPDADRVEVYRALNGERDTRGMTDAQTAAVAEGRRLTTEAGGMYATETGRRKLAYGGGKLASSAQINPGSVRLKFTGRAPAEPEPDPFDASDFLGGNWLHGSELLDTVNPGRSVRSGLPTKPVIESPANGRRIRGRVERPLDLGEMSDFAAPASEGVLDSSNIRSRYLPAPHTADAAQQSADREAFEFNPLRPYAGNKEARDAFTVDPKDVGGLDQAFRASLSSAARQGTAGQLRSELKAKFGGQIPSEIMDLLTVKAPARGAERTAKEKAADFWRGVVNLPKTAVVGTSPKHIANIMNLALNTDPGAVPGAIKTAAQLMRDPSSRYEKLKPAIDLGAISPSGERTTSTIDWLERLPGALAAPGKAMRKMNDATWAFDDAMVSEIAKRLAASGEKSGYSAGRAARRSLIDYDHISPFTEHAKNVAPFATFNTQLPAAVLKGILRSPARAEALNRATGGTMYGGTAQAGGHKISTYLPTSDVGKLDGPAMARKTIADPIRAALTTAGVEAHGQKNYFTYGSPIDMKWLMGAAAAGIPEARDALDAIGLGTFKPRGMLQTLLANFTGVGVR